MMSSTSIQFDDTAWSQRNTGKESINEWSNEQVVDWARDHIGITDEIANFFLKNKINGLELLALGREDLRELGISRPGTLALVVKAVNDLQMRNQYHE
eukprot:10618930-Ditylum_brightwellii.AAC.1